MARLFDTPAASAKAGQSVRTPSGSVSLVKDAQQEGRMGILSAIGTVLTHTAVGIQNPAALLELESKKEQQRQLMKKQAAQEQFQQMLMAQAFGGSFNPTQQVVPPKTISQANNTPQGSQPLQSRPNGMGAGLGGSVVPPTQLGVVGGKMGGATIGQLAESKIPQDIFKAVETKRAKDQLTTEQDLLNVDLKIDNSFDSFLDVVESTKDITGAGPGIIGGTFSKVLGAVKANEFVEGFEGGLIEVAAATGRIAIPGARATRLVDLFKKTGISINDNIESAVVTSADSFRNGITTDMSRNPNQYIEGYSSMNKEQRREARVGLKDQAREFEKVYKDTLFKRVYKRNPDLLQEKTRNRIKDSLGADNIDLELQEIDKRLQELGGL